MGWAWEPVSALGVCGASRRAAGGSEPRGGDRGAWVAADRGSRLGSAPRRGPGGRRERAPGVCGEAPRECEAVGGRRGAPRHPRLGGRRAGRGLWVSGLAGRLAMAERRAALGRAVPSSSSPPLAARGGSSCCWQEPAGARFVLCQRMLMAGPAMR